MIEFVASGAGTDLLQESSDRSIRCRLTDVVDLVSCDRLQAMSDGSGGLFAESVIHAGFPFSRAQ